MSWSAYVDNLMAYKCLTHVGLFDNNTGDCWASTPDFPISRDQLKKIAQGFRDVTNVSQGVNVGSEKFVFIRGEPNYNMLFKKGVNGVYAQKSVKCMIIGIHDGSVKAETAIAPIAKIVDYLSSIQY